MSSDGKLYRLPPTVGVGTMPVGSSTNSTTGTISGAPQPSKSARPHTQPPFGSDLNNNQIQQSSSTAGKSIAITSSTPPVSSTTSQSPAINRIGVTRTAGTGGSSRAASSPPPVTSSSTRQVEEVQVSLVINRTSAGGGNHHQHQKSSESDTTGNVGNDLDDDVKSPFKITSVGSVETTKANSKDKDKEKDGGNQLRRSSANLAAEANSLGIEMPDAKIGKSIFFILSC